MGVTQGAGLSLQWFRNRFAPEVAYDDLTADALFRLLARTASFGCPT